MTDLNEYVQGTCQQMCPDEEIKMREREGLIHKLEALPGTGTKNKPKADKSRMVKSFSRSAAGARLNVAKNLRPAPVLRQTVAYLLHDVATANNLPWNVIYDFIMDRLRAVRQDMVIQNLSGADYISLLQPMIRFYAFSAYKLCEASRDVFDPVINKKHLEECLKRLLTLYDEYDCLDKKSRELSDGKQFNFEDRPFFEALYILLNLGDGVALTRAVELPKKLRNTPVIGLALIISRNYRLGNWMQTCRLFQYLSPLLCAVAALHLPIIRRRALKIMTIAYSSKNLKFPAEHLKKLLLYNTLDDLFFDCIHFGLNCNEKEGFVQFLKGNFCDDKTDLPQKHQKLVDSKLKKHSIPNLMLENTL